VAVKYVGSFSAGAWAAAAGGGEVSGAASCARIGLAVTSPTITIKTVKKNFLRVVLFITCSPLISLAR
jgi:hypothetical protein